MAGILAAAFVQISWQGAHQDNLVQSRSLKDGLAENEGGVLQLLGDEDRVTVDMVFTAHTLTNSRY